MRYGPKRRALQCLLLGIENLTGTQGGTQRMRPGWMPFLGLTLPTLVSGCHPGALCWSPSQWLVLGYHLPPACPAATLSHSTRSLHLHPALAFTSAWTSAGSFTGIMAPSHASHLPLGRWAEVKPS